MAQVGIVYAKQDGEPVAALLQALERADLSTRIHLVKGLPGTPLVPEHRELADERVVVVVWTPWLRCSDWAFGVEARACLADPRCQVILVGVVGRPCTNYGSSPVARCEVLAPLRVDGGNSGAVLRTLKRRVAGPPKRLRRGNPGQGFDRHDDAVIAERLEALHALAALGTPRLKAQIKRTQQAFGDELRPGGFVVDGTYRLLSHAGNGPTASVWKAWDRQTDSLVALRMLHPQWATDEARVDRFFRGASALGAVKHRAIAPPRDTGGVDRGIPYYVRDWYALGGLEHALEHGNVDRIHALQATIDAASALVAVHQKGVVHGNVKPANILLDGERRAFLSDFKGDAVQQDETLYVAPELQDGGGALTPAADVYSLAMCVLFALHGKPLPFWVLRDPARLVDGLSLPMGDASVPLPRTARGALLGALEWSVQRRTGSIQGFLEGFYEDRAVLAALKEHAVRTGHHAAAAEHIEALLACTEGRPIELVLTLGQSWAAAAEDQPEVAQRARELLFEGLRRAPDRQTIDSAVTTLRGLCDDEALLGMADLLHDIEGDATVVAACRVQAARIHDALGDQALAAATWNEVIEIHCEWSEAVEAHRALVRAAAQDPPADFVEVARRAFPYTPEPDRGALAYRIGVLAQDGMQDLPEALRWLERAQERRHGAEDLSQRLEAIRSARGEWRQVVALLLERADRLDDESEAVVLLVRAARVAMHAHNHHDEAATILLRVLLLDPHHREALRFLARYHARQGRDERALALYSRLAPHEERGRDGETVAIRVADNVDYAHVLLRNDRPRGAQLCLEAALDLNPSHVPTLRLAAQLAFDLGKWDEARVANQGLAAAFGSATADPVLVRAHLKLGDLAWLHGDLLAAIESYNAAQELSPLDPLVWWGKAKVALAGLNGRLAAAHHAEEPWLLAAPVRFTPMEGLARLLAALVYPPAMAEWMRLDPMGREMAALLVDQHTLVRACGAVDLMLERRLIGPELFERLLTRHPGWTGPVDAMRQVWFEEGTLDPVSTYRWQEAAAHDFDTSHHRELMAPPEISGEAVRRSLVSLADRSAWDRLFASADQAPRAPATASAGQPTPTPAPVGLLEFFPFSAERRTIRVDRAVLVGSGVQDDLSLAARGLKPAHAELVRVGDAFYIRGRSGLVVVDTKEVEQRRLVGGERIRLGTLEGTFSIHARHTVSATVARPEIGLKSGGGDVLERVERAALFYRDGIHDRIIPLTSRAIILRDSDDLEVVPVEPDEDDHGVTIEGGMFWFHEPDAAPRRLNHGDEIVVGLCMLTFKELSRGDETPVDLAALWGAPENAPVLVFDDGTKLGRPIVLDRAAYTVGRGRTADFQVSFDTSLSREHSVFSVRGERVTVRDLGSANGTAVNGVYIEVETPLFDGDSIQVGQSRFQFKSSITGVQNHEPEARFPTDEQTEVLHVGERVRAPLALDEGLEKIRITNRALELALSALDEVQPGRGQTVLETMVAALPRSYNDLLAGIEVRGNSLPGLEVMFNVAQRPDLEQRSLLNHVLQDVVERAIERVCVERSEIDVEPMLLEIAETRYRDVLRI